MKRIVLFLFTNLAVMLVLSIAASVLGVNRYLTANGLKHMLLPAVNLALFKMALMIRLARAGTREVMLTDMVRFARAAGESEWTILRHHVLRLIAIPLVLLARALSTGLPLAAIMWWRPIPQGAWPILTWSGLRGGISICGVAGIPSGAALGVSNRRVEREKGGARCFARSTRRSRGERGAKQTLFFVVLRVLRETSACSARNALLNSVFVAMPLRRAPGPTSLRSTAGHNSL